MKQAVVLVGGRGTRMWPLTDSMPKGLLPVAGHPFIEMQFTLLSKVGIEQVILAADRYHSDAWNDYAGNHPEFDLVVSVEEERLDTAGPLMLVLDMLDDQFLVLNGDVVVEGGVTGMAEGMPDGIDAVVGVIAVDDPSPYGVVETDANGRVQRFVEKPPSGTEPGNLVNAGVYLLRRSALDGYVAGPLSFERQVFPDLVSGGRLGAVELKGPWVDIGTPALYLAAHAEIAAGRSSLADPWDWGGESWNWIDDAAVIDADASVSRSVVLGPALVGAGAVIEDAIIGWGASIGEGTRISSHSVVGSHATVGSRCELTAGVRIAPRANLEDGSVTFSPPK